MSEPTLSEFWYQWKKLAEKDVEGQYKLGIAYYFDKLGIAEDKIPDGADEKLSIQWLKKAALEGYVLAQYFLGLHFLGRAYYARNQGTWKSSPFDNDGYLRTSFDPYQHDDPIEVNDRIAHYEKEAKQQFRKLVKNGCSSAKIFLGEEYEGVANSSENPREALRWIYIAAETGNTDAIYHLGKAYQDGAGVAEDKIEALELFKQIAWRKHIAAQLSLAEMYWNGDGPIKDEREAYIWWLIAEAHGDKTAKTRLTETDWKNFFPSGIIFSARRTANRRLLRIDQIFKRATQAEYSFHPDAMIQNVP